MVKATKKKMLSKLAEAAAACTLHNARDVAAND